MGILEKLRSARAKNRAQTQADAVCEAELAEREFARRRALELPQDMRELVVYVNSLHAARELISGAEKLPAVPAHVHVILQSLSEVHDVILRIAHEHPRFAEFYPKESAELDKQLAQTGMIGPYGRGYETPEVKRVIEVSE